MRPYARDIVAAALRGGVAALASALPPARERRVALRYRCAGPGWNAERFARHCAWLAAHALVVPFARLRDVDGGGRPVVALTLDHGFAADHRDALPALERHGFGATFFLTVGLVEGDARVRDRFRRAFGGAAAMRWSQVRELVAAGMAIGARGWSGLPLARLRRERARRDLARAKAAIEDALGEAVADMAYPGGAPRRDWDERSVALARGVGFARGATLVERAVRPDDDVLAMPRFAADGLDETTLAHVVAGRRDLVGALQERAPASLVGCLAPARECA